MQYTKYQTNQNVIQALFVCPPPASFSGGLGRTLLRPRLSANLARDWRPPALPAEGISEQSEFHNHEGINQRCPAGPYNES